MIRALQIRLAVSVALAGLVVLLSSQPATASSLSFSLKNGRVTILAYGVTLKEILSAWESLGRVSIVHGDRLSGPPITLELRDVPEAKALDVLLRSVSGYVAVSRSEPIAIGSIFQSITILSTSRAPLPPPPVTAQAPSPRGPVPLSAALGSTSGPPDAPFSQASGGPTAVAGGAAERGQAGDPRFVPLSAVEQAGLRQSQQELQDFLARSKGSNSMPAPGPMPAPAASTDASRPGSITPYTPPPSPRPGSPQVPKR